MNNTVRAIIKGEQEVFSAGGRNHFLLDRGDSIYYVLEGKVNIFAVTLSGGQPAGNRNYVAGYEEGQFIFGFSRELFDSAGMGLLVNGSVDTRVMRIDRARITSLTRYPGHQREIAAIVDAWLDGIAQQRQAEGKAPAALQPGAGQSFEEGELLRPAKGTLWVTFAEGRGLVDGDATRPVGPEDGMRGLSHPSSIEVREKALVDAFETVSVLGRSDFWERFAGHHREIMDAVRRRIEEDARQERERVALRDRTQREKISGALRDLRDIIDPGEESGAFAASDDSMLSACREVGAFLNIDIQAPPPAGGGGPDRLAGTLASIARASRIRTRRVALKGQWWKRDNGPMVGYTAGDKRPVALIPRTARSYEVYDPGEKARYLLTDGNAESIDYFADVLYRTFPAKVMKGWEILKFGAAGRSGDILTILLMGLLGGLLGLLTPVITGVIFDEVIPGVQLNQLFMLSMAMIVSGIATACFEFTRRMAILRMEGRMDQHVQGAVIDRLIELPMEFYRDYSSGDLADRAMGINAIRQVLSGTTINAIISGAFSLFNLALLFYYSTTLAGWAILITAVIIAVMVGTNFFQLRTQKKMAQLNGDLSGKVLEFIMGISKFRVAGCEDRAFSIWAGMFGDMKRVSRKSRLIANAVDTYISFLPILSSMIIFFLILRMSEKEPMSIGSFLAFNASFGQFLSSTLQIMDSLVTTLSVVPLYQRSKPILETAPETDLEKIHPGDLSGMMELNQVSFSYSEDGPQIIDNVSMRVEPGEFVALVGPSGSGKSTMIRLLLGFEKPTAGGVYYDEQDLSGLDVRAVRQQMGVVLQNGQVMPGDILSNIVGSSLLTVDDAWDAARRAGLENDIRAMPMGMYTVISEGGGGLSGGQRQRLIIARALARKPKILIFDEATSALDNETQAIVNRSLEELNTTRVVIAHRLSTIVNAKRIYVLERGRIVQTGTYDELISREGVFADIARRQIT